MTDDAFVGWATYYHRRGYPPTERTYRLIQAQVRLKSGMPPAPAQDDIFRQWLADVQAAHEAQITDIDLGWIAEIAKRGLTGPGLRLLLGFVAGKVGNVLNFIPEQIRTWAFAVLGGLLVLLGVVAEAMGAPGLMEPILAAAGAMGFGQAVVVRNRLAAKGSAGWKTYASAGAAILVGGGVIACFFLAPALLPTVVPIATVAMQALDLAVNASLTDAAGKLPAP